MRLKFAVLFCIVLLLDSAAALWAYDAVDELLANGPSSSTDESSTVLDQASPGGDISFDRPGGALTTPDSTRSDSTGPEPTRPKSSRDQGPDDFVPADDQPSTEIGLNDSLARSESNSKSTPDERVDTVPEPSALAMAAAALIFFLFLGRRRPVG